LFGFNNSSEEKTVLLKITPTFHLGMGAHLSPLIAENSKVKILKKEQNIWEIELTIPARSAVAYQIG
jgi:sulfite reductase alpha subunit-like flavoprotein